MIYLIMVNILASKKDIVMDAIHDVFCKIAADDNAFQDVSNIKFYLFRALKNRLLDIYKSQKIHISITYNNEIIESLPFDLHVNIEDKIIDVEEREQIEKQIVEMLASLTARQREVVYLRYVQEYDYKQIADLLNISVQSCRNLVSKSILSLRDKYRVLLFLIAFS